MRKALLLLLSLLVAAGAFGASKTRRSHRNMAVRNHLAVPAAASCTDVDGDGTQDSILMDGDICVDTDDETFCWYVGGNLECATGTDMAGFQRTRPTLFDDFLQNDEYDNSALASAQPVETNAFRWRWVPTGTPSGSSIAHTLPTSEDAGHLGILQLTLGDNDDGGIRTPQDSEGWGFQVVPSHFSKLTLHVLLKIDAAGTDQPADMQADIGFCKSLSGGDCQGDRNFVIELISRTSSFEGPAYGHVRCDNGTTNTGKIEFSPSWEVDENWHRWSIVYDKSAATVTFYRDGTQVGQCTSGQFDDSVSYYVVPITAETSNNAPTEQTFYVDYVQLLAEPESSVQR